MTITSNSHKVHPETQLCTPRTTEQWHTSEFSICSLPNGRLYMYVTTFIKSNLQWFQEAQSWGFKFLPAPRLKKKLVRLMWTCADMIKLLHFEFTCSNSYIAFLKSVSINVSVSNVLFCLLPFAQPRCSKAEKIKWSHLCLFILTVHFISENWLLFWYNCGLHEKSSAEKLIFLCKCCKCTYCSCVMLYD